MKKTFLVTLYIVTALVLNAKQKIMPLQSKDGIEIIPAAKFNASLWSINNYKKNQKVKISNTRNKTPDGKPACAIVFNGKGGGCNVVYSKFAPDGVWQTRNYDGISLWVTGKAKLGFVNLFTYDSQGHRFSWRIPVTNNWKQVILKKGSASNRQGYILDLKNTRGLAFFSSSDADFEFGDIRFTEGKNSLHFQTVQCLNIPIISRTPVIDGKLSDKEWENAYKIKNLKLINTMGPAKEKTEVLLCSDNEKLYIGVKLYSVNPAGQLKNMQKRDSQVYLDDSFEILVNPKVDGKTYAHIVFNQLGTLMDYYYRYDQEKEAFIFDYRWNPEVDIKTGWNDRYWSAELAISLKDLGISKRIPFNLQLGRENHSVKEFSALGSTSRFTELQNFLLAEIDAPSKQINIANVGLTLPDKLKIEGTIKNSSSVNLNVTLTNPYASIQEVSRRLNVSSDGTFSIPLEIKGPSTGDYILTLNGNYFAPEQLRFKINIPSNVHFGDFLLNPVPKKLKKGKGEFKFNDSVPITVPVSASMRTRKTARFLRTEIHQNLFGMNPQIVDSVITGKKIKLMLRKDCNISSKELQNSIRELPAEGYLLKATPEEVLIVGADEPGLYYGVVTLIQLVRNHLLKKHEPVIPCVTINDWPDLKHRYVQHWTQFYKRFKEPKVNLDFYKQFIKEVVAGSKMNAFSLRIDYTFEYDQAAKITRRNAIFSRQDYAELARFCKEHFVEFIPAFQSGGHSSYITRNYKYLQDPGFDHRQANVSDERFYDLIFKCYDEILETIPDVKYFNIWHDEWWTRPKKDKTADFQGVPRWKIFADDIIKNNNYFKKRGIKMMMCADMILKNHNGGPPMNIYKALKVIPKDIIITNWSLRSAPDGSKELNDLGFKVWDVVNTFRTIPAQDIKIVTGYGCIVYTHFWQTFWYSRDNILPRYSHAPFRAGQYAWNIKSDPQLSLEEWRSRYMNCVKALYYFPKRKIEDLKYKPIDLSTKANLSTKKWFGQPGLAPVLPHSKTNVGFVPFTFTAKTNNVIASEDGEEIVLPLKPGDYNGLIFLQGTYMSPEMRKKLKEISKNYQFGVPVGEIRVEYTDGPSEIIPLLCGMNTLSITPLAIARFMYMTRYTWDIKTVSGKDASLYLYEWVNPYPLRKIKQVVWKGYGNNAFPVLFGLTAYGNK